MKQEVKKVNYYRLSLKEGIRHNIAITENYRLAGSGGGYFAYLARCFDTQDYDSTYHRLQLEGTFTKCKYEILVAATNENISSSIYRDNLDPLFIPDILKEYSHVRRVNYHDILLHELTGRYLWVFISITASDLNAHFEIDGFSVEFPKSSFTEYLPEIYREDDNTFFERYMAVLQSLYVDLEEEVDKLPVQLDYETTRQENLEMFADWLGVDVPGVHLTPRQLRFIIARLQKLQSGKGTVSVLQQMLYLITGKEISVVEYFRWHDWMKKHASLEENYRTLFGKDETVFTILVDCTKDTPDKLPKQEMLMKIINNYMPLGMRCNLVFLRVNSHMDMHCYLDVNGSLSTPTKADTSGFVLGSNHVLG